MQYLTSLVILGKFSLGLSLTIVIRELGYMLFAKLFGVDVSEYMIGLPPKVCSFKWGKTTYVLGLIPFGASATIEGMLDSSASVDGLHQRSCDRRYKVKQIIVNLGGIILNLASAFIIYTIMLYVVGTLYLPKEELNKHGIYPTQLGATIGLCHGDRVMKKNNKEFTSFSDLHDDITYPLSYTIRRGEQRLDVRVPQAVVDAMNRGEDIMEPLVPFVVGDITPNSIADRLGLRRGGTLLAINEHPTLYLQDLKEILDRYAKKKVTFTYQEDGKVYKKELILPKKPSLGAELSSRLEGRLQYYSLAQASKKTLYKIGAILQLHAKGLALFGTVQISRVRTLRTSLEMIDSFPTPKGSISFWLIMFLILLFVAFIYALPLLPFDGGQVMILLYELVTRKEFPIVWRIQLQKTCIAMSVTIMFLTILRNTYI